MWLKRSSTNDTKIMTISKFEIRFFSVGNSKKGGDAILIRLYDKDNNPTVIVIDGGYSDNGQEILDYLTNCGLDKIDLVVNTHPDMDHISGLIAIFKDENIKIGKLLMNRPWRDANLKVTYFEDGRITEKSLNKRLTESFKQAYQLEQLARGKIGENNIVHPVRGNVYFDVLKIIGPSTDLYRKHLLASDKTPTSSNADSVRVFSRKILKFVRYVKGTFIGWIDGENTSDINETSIVMALSLPGYKFLFTGDVGKDGLKESLDYYETFEGCQAKDFTHMQIPHHGSRKNLNPSLIRRIGATTYYVSCPPDGFSEGHPSKRLINKIKQMYPEAYIYYTKRGWLSHFKNLEIGGSPADSYPVFDEIDI